MGTQTIERTEVNVPVTYPEAEDGGDQGLLPELTPGEAPPIFGRCPVCRKALRPRDKLTNEPQAPPVNAGIHSRAKCDFCGTIIVYVGNSEWRVALPTDFSAEDMMADKLGL